MHPFLERLKEWGCTVENTQAVILCDENFYMTMIPLALQDPQFRVVERAIQRGDPQRTYREARTLAIKLNKMGMIPMLVTMAGIFRPIDQGTMDGVAEAFAQLIHQRDTVMEWFRELA